MTSSVFEFGVRKARLLVSANDPGAAFHICEVLKRGKERGVFEFCVVASAITKEIFENAGFPAKQVNAPRSKQWPSKCGIDNISKATDLIDNFLPDAILVGLSGPDLGFDEGLIAAAGALPTYAVQDFWGDVNNGYGHLPGTYFVLDENAAKLTSMRAPDARVIITGSARHAAWSDLQPETLRAEYRHALGLAKNEVCVTFYGQPLWKAKGYHTTLSKLSDALSQSDETINFCYRPHPKETVEERDRALVVIRRAGIRARTDANQTLVASLCGADLALTCYSMCGLDLANLSRLSASPLGLIVYAMFDDEIRRLFQRESGLLNIPLVEQGLASVIDTPNEIKRILRISLTREEQKEKWKAASSQVCHSNWAASIIVDTIAHDISENLKRKSLRAQ